MDVYKCTVALGGNIGMTVHKDGCSVAELVMLRYLHGDVSVTEIEKTGTKPGDSVSERDYLNYSYRTPKVAEVFGPYGELPMKIAEAKIPDSYFADPPKKATKKKAAAAPKKEEPEAAAE
tara:strand:- start:371 stop:730 length:360 start_codon:yes stop_codon:yes gene_type:complete